MCGPLKFRPHVPRTGFAPLTPIKATFNTLYRRIVRKVSFGQRGFAAQDQPAPRFTLIEYTFEEPIERVRAFSDIGHQNKRGPVFDPVVKFMNEFRLKPGKPAEQVFLSCGVYESLIYYNRSMVPLLQETGMQVRFREANDGHNWENWRDRLRDGLSWLFPGPLLLVYE